jgi:hypothetical protein
MFRQFDKKKVKIRHHNIEFHLSARIILFSDTVDINEQNNFHMAKGMIVLFVKDKGHNRFKKPDETQNVIQENGYNSCM